MYLMEQDLRAAAQDSKIQAALCSKVSRERVGVELSGMLTGKVTASVCLLLVLHTCGILLLFKKIVKKPM